VFENFALSDCHFAARLEHWRDHNLTEAFDKFYRGVIKLSSKVVNVLHNK
jgi:hypothetical protein